MEVRRNSNIGGVGRISPKLASGLFSKANSPSRFYGYDDGLCLSNSRQFQELPIHENKCAAASENQQNAENILPEEVWELILKRFTESGQIWRLSLTCQLFQNVILKPSKNAWLFQELFPILFECLEGKLILKCRSVCKSWRDRVDSFFENHSALQPHSDGNHNPRMPRFFCPMLEKGICQYSFSVDDPKDSENLKLIAAHPQNPFIGRRLALEIWLMAERTEFPDVPNTNVFDDIETDLFGGLKICLDNLGQYLRHLKFFVAVSGYSSNQEKSAFQFINRFLFQKLLQLVPNLRSLSIHGVDGDICSKNLNFEGAALESVAHFALPDLVELDFGKGIGNSYTQGETKLLLRYHNQLECLRMSSTRSLRWSHLADLQFSRLTELDVGGIFDDSLAHEDLRRLLHLNAPNLRKLSLCPECLETQYYSDFIQILNELSAKAPHLNIIRLTLNRSAARWAEGLESTSANLCAPPCIKTLELLVLGRVPVTYFHGLLLRFRLVENLNIGFRNEADFQDQQCGIQCYLAGKKVSELHLWTFMPRLEILSMDKKVHTRKCFEDYVVKQSTEAEDNSSLFQMD